MPGGAWGAPLVTPPVPMLEALPGRRLGGKGPEGAESSGVPPRGGHGRGAGVVPGPRACLCCSGRCDRAVSSGGCKPMAEVPAPSVPSGQTAPACLSSRGGEGALASHLVWTVASS